MPNMFFEAEPVVVNGVVCRDEAFVLVEQPSMFSRKRSHRLPTRDCCKRRSTWFTGRPPGSS